MAKDKKSNFEVLEENRKAHEAILKALENNSSFYESSKADNKQLCELREGHKKELKNLENEFETQKKRLHQQIDSLTEKNNELEMKVKVEH